jgi:hypothetical protein
MVRMEAASPQAVRAILDFLNDPGVLRLRGDVRIPRERELTGPAAVIDGVVELDGLVRGDLVIVNGDLILGANAAVLGSVVIVGGALEGGDPEQVSEGLTVVSRPISLVEDSEGIFSRRAALTETEPALYLGSSRTRFTVRSGAGYNRVEGLPILFGPVIRTGGERPFQLDALAIFRTEFPVALRNLGYAFRAEQGFGQKPVWRLGATAYSRIQGLRNDQASPLFRSLSTAIFHEDPQDYQEVEGWSTYLEIAGEGTPARLRLTYREEDHRLAIPGDPWTLFNQDRLWRPMPLTAVGDLRSLEGTLEVDFRNNPEDATDGWYLRADARVGLGGSLRTPAFATAPLGPTTPSQPVDATFQSLGVDVRRYLRVDPDSDLALRGVVRSALNQSTLPAQYQFLLGGVGSLPAYPFFRLDCGARAVAARTTEEDVARVTYPRFGCDGIALFQLEFREGIDVGLDLSSSDPGDRRWWPDVDLSLSWHVFLNAGQGWSYADGGVDVGTLADAGVGLSIGGLGFYYAHPLSEGEGNGRFFVRLRRRF